MKPLHWALANRAEWPTGRNIMRKTLLAMGAALLLIAAPAAAQQ
jgi:hypothetical protein